MSSSDLFSLYIAIAAEDRIHTSPLLKVYCPEILPYYDGSLSDKTVTDTVSITNDSDDSVLSVSADTSNTITATFLSLDSASVLPPYTRKGERVLLLKYSDADVYRWIDLGIDKRLRGYEVIRFAAANTNGGEDITTSNSYIIEIDTLNNQHIMMQTSASHGEAFQYCLKLDAKRKKAFLTDNQGRFFNIDSPEDTVVMKNNAGSFVAAAKDNILLNAISNISLQAGGDIALVAAGNITFKGEEITQTDSSGTSVITMNSGSVTQTVGGSTTSMSSNVVTTSASQIAVSSPDGGGMNVSSGKTDIKGPTTFEQQVTMNQGLQTSGDISASGAIHGSNI
jgi:hypothetical protein